MNVFLMCLKYLLDQDDVAHKPTYPLTWTCATAIWTDETSLKPWTERVSGDSESRSSRCDSPGIDGIGVNLAGENCKVSVYS